MSDTIEIRTETVQVHNGIPYTTEPFDDGTIGVYRIRYETVAEVTTTDAVRRAILADNA